MTNKEICELCNEYDAEHQCEHYSECKLIKINKENRKLKQKIAELENKIHIQEWKDYPDMMGK